MNLMIYSVLSLSFGGGFERWASEITPRLRKNGYGISLITTKAGNNLGTRAGLKKKIVEAGVKVFELDNYEKPLTIPKLTYLRDIIKIAKEADVIYFNNTFAGNETLMTAVKRISDTPVCAGYHGTFPEVGNKLRRFYHSVFGRSFSRLLDAHHVVNRERLNLLRSWGYRNVYQIANGIDLTKFRAGQKNNVFTLAFVGRLCYQKGFDILSDLIRHLNKTTRSRIDIRFLVCGVGPYSAVARNLDRSFDNVKWLGYCTEEELIEVYQRSHLLVAPSRYGYEEFLLTSLEAQACGTPTISSNIPGPRETVINGVTGFLVKPSLERFLDAILRFKDLWYKSRDHYYQYSHNARRNALNYDWNIIIRKLEKMLVEVSNL